VGGWHREKLAYLVQQERRNNSPVLEVVDPLLVRKAMIGRQEEPGSAGRVQEGTCAVSQANQMAKDPWRRTVISESSKRKRSVSITETPFVFWKTGFSQAPGAAVVGPQ
jgi:hypothetical protein